MKNLFAFLDIHFGPPFSIRVPSVSSTVAKKESCTANEAVAISDDGFISIDVSSANSISARDVPADGWFAFATFGDHPSPDRTYTQVFHQEQAEEMVRTFNSIAGKFGRLNKNLRHRLAARFSIPIFEHHIDTDPRDWSQLEPLAEGTDLRVTGNALEVFVKWHTSNMAQRGAGPLYPSALWWHEPPDRHHRVFPMLLESIALVPNPNIASVPAWTTNSNQNQNPMNKEQLAALCKALNLPESTDPAKVIETAQSASQLSTSNATALQTANSEKTELETKLATANTAKEKSEADLKTANTGKEKAEGELKTANAANEILLTGVLDVFEAAGKFTPAQRPEIKAKFTANMAESAAVIAELKTKKPELNVQHLEINGNRIDISTANARQEAVATAVEKVMAETKCDYNTAFAKVQGDKKYAQLFGTMADPTREKAA